MQKKRKVWNTVLICLLTAVLAAGSGALSAKENTEETEQKQQDQGELKQREEQDSNLSSAEEIEEQKKKQEEDETEITEFAEIIEEKNSGITKKTSSKKNAEPQEQNIQTRLDVRKGSIEIKATGAVGGGLSKAETSLNPKGYYITGTTTANSIVVDPGVTTELTFDNVSITNQSRAENCVTVSHANVTITLIGNNTLTCGRSNYGALVKDGMDDTSLIIQCEHVGEQGHKCTGDICGTLNARGTVNHATAIGNMLLNRDVENETGFCNLTIKGGIINAQAGAHNSAIGAGCNSYAVAKGYTKDIVISGGTITAIGGEHCAGLGSGSWTPVDGLYITGGTVYASGGMDSPGVGSGGSNVDSDFYNGKAKVDISNIVISGGDTVVKAVGDQSTNMPGIGCGKPPIGDPDGTVTNVIASPNAGYQGYIQDGTTEDNYNFTDESPFHSDTAISVEKYYTKIYFGPYRDENTIAKDTKEQIGANHVISKTGGIGFTESQLKELTKVNGKQKEGTGFPTEDLTFKDISQIEKINAAKTSGKIGDYPLTFQTPNGTEVTVTVSLRDSGTDASKFDPENPTPVIGANDFEKDTGGDAFTEEQLKKYGEVKGKDKEGNTISLDGFTIDTEQFKKINEAKTSGKTGVFDLTYTAADGNQVKVKVSLVGYDEIKESPETGESIKGMNVISKTGGECFTENQLKDLSKVKAYDENGHEIDADEISFPEPEQIELINKAKEAGETGDFSLTFQTKNGTKVTVTVYLREEGTDGAKADKENPEPSIAASDGEHKTGGAAFTKEELIGLCKAKGKDENRNNTDINVSKEEMDKLNVAKQEGKTGTFDLTFSVAGGKEAKVTVTLTGEHRVSFNPNGGDFTPKTQTVTGGKCAVEPKEPKRRGYTFEGWFYKDENGKEQKWNFDTPVHSDVSLKAVWKKESTPKDNETDSGKTKKKKSGDYSWEGEEINENGSGSSKESTAKTGDTADFSMAFVMLAAGGGILTLLLHKNRKNK
ncbi:InlB B-repeat-containing protein [Anaerostipes caccae]|uniref:InlB B-repeat-containing protein n=1 Tax=Anaerostipes caccae TaxID=105841 RepID=UPI0038D3E005